MSEEFNCLPVENKEFEELSAKRALEALKPRREVRYIGQTPGSLHQARTVLPTEQSAFVVSIISLPAFHLVILQPTLISHQQAARPAKSKPQENKTTRMPQNELLDRIYELFRQYRYWRFKGLKSRLLQPEAYLKQTLEMVAHLVKSGDMVNSWELKPEARESTYANAWGYGEPKNELCPDDDEVSDDEGSGMDNDDTQFENVS